MPGGMDEISLRAPAKVNLHLGIHPGRDERGYHRADSVMIPLALSDEICVRRSDAPGARYTPELSIAVEKSAVFRAIRAFEAAFAPRTSFSVEIARHVPGSGGLGSSSTDAAGALRGMAVLEGIALDDARLARIARSIGADVPFFLDARPALYRGAGDVLSKAFPSLRVPIALVMPPAGVSTASAYCRFDQDPIAPRMPDAMVAALDAADPAAVAAALYNNLAPAACTLEPAVGECLAWLRVQEGILGAQVTGSGSCSFAICACDEVAERIAQASPWWACATHTC